MTIQEFTTLFTDAAAINNFILIAFFLVFALVFFAESRDPKSTVHWPDLLLDPKTGKLSLAKFGQFWGIAISTWVTIFLAQNPNAYGIFPMVFPMYLAYIGGTWSYNAWLKSKQPGGDASPVITKDELPAPEEADNPDAPK